MTMDVKKVGIMYVCNQCGKLYKNEEAYLAKGNTYFCSMKCVLAHDEENE